MKTLKFASEITFDATAAARRILRQVSPRFRFALTALACLGALGSGSTRAATISWTSASSGEYTNSANWSGGKTPSTNDFAVIGSTAKLSPGTVMYDMNGSVSSDPLATNYLASLMMGNAASSVASFTFNSGMLTITNTGTIAFNLCSNTCANSSATFTMNGGTLNVIRNSSTFYQDSFQMGIATNSTATFTLNGGVVNAACGVELGNTGVGTLSVNGGTFIDNGWFGLGRGNSGFNGSGIFNLTGGTVYLLRNPGTESGDNGLSMCQGGTNAAVNISGGSLYCNAVRFCAAGSNFKQTNYQTLNVSGGNLYIGPGGVYSNGAGANMVFSNSINLSGGTFHTLDLATNTGGILGTNTILSDGTNWSWNTALAANLSNSPGSGVITFAPEAARTIALYAPFSGTGGLAMAGPGTLVFSNVDTYTGPTALNGGTTMGAGQITGGTVTVNTGAIVEPGSATAAGTLTLGNGLTLNNDSTNILKLNSDPTQVNNGVNDLIVSAGGLTINGVTTVEVVPLAPLGTGSPYTLFEYSGTTLPSGSQANFNVISPSPRYSFSVVDPSTTPGSVVAYAVGNAATLLWRGKNATYPTAWDHTTLNWSNTTTLALDVFYTGDTTVFDDSGLTNLVTIATNIQTGLMALSNNAVAYTFAGNGQLSGPLDIEGNASGPGSLTLALANVPTFAWITNNNGTLLFNLANSGVNTVAANIADNGAGDGVIIQGGTNTLLLAGSNSAYNGALIVSNGLLQCSAGSALGNTTTSLYVTNNGSLDLQLVNIGAKPVVVSGAGYNGIGALTDTAVTGGTFQLISSITLAGDATFGASLRWETMPSGSTFTGNGHNLTTVGASTGVINLDNTGPTGLGNINIIGSRLIFQANIDLGDPTKTVTVGTNQTLTFYSLSSPVGKVMVLTNGATFDSGGAANTFTGPITLYGTNSICTRGDLHLQGGITGTGAIISITNDPVGYGQGALYLEGTNTYTGPTILASNSVVRLGSATGLGASALYLLNTGSTLDVSAPTSVSLGAGQTVQGVGTLNGGAITFGSGSALIVGLTATTTSNLTVNGTLTFQNGSTNVLKINSKTGTNDTVSGSYSVTYGGTLVVTNITTNMLTAGQTFTLYPTASAYNGKFDALVLPSLGAGLIWNTANLTVNGSIAVAVQPQITGATMSGGTFQVSFTGPVGASYTLLAATNVTLPLSSWTVVGTGTITNSPMTVPDSTSSGYSQRFYTIAVP
jgi:autotransporter-associated beta strand protein